jgi:hypothetical protein
LIAGRVVMLSRDQGLASIAGQLIGWGQPLTRFSSPTDVPDWLRPPTGVVVLDYPKPERVIVYRELRQRYLGPVLALLDPDESSSGLPVDQARIGILHRPFNGGELSASLDALVGSRNIARRTKSRALTAPPVGANAVAAAGLEPGPQLEATAAFAAPAALAPTPARAAIQARPGATPAADAAPAKALWPRAKGHRTAGVPGPVPLRLPAAARFATAAGIPAAKVAQRRVAEAARRGLALRHPGPTARRRLNDLALVLAALSALVLGATLSDGRGCPSTGCGSVAGAAESGGVVAGGPPTATPQMGAQPAEGQGQQAAPKASDDPAPAPQPAAGMIIGLASGVDDLLRGTSSSSGGAPLLTVTSGPTPPASGGGGSDGGSGGGVPVPATQPPATSPPVTTAPPTTTAPPATTAPPVTDPPTTTEPPPTTTEPPPTTTEPPPTTTEPPPTTTEPPPTTEPATTATTSATSETSPPSSTSLA